MKNKFNLAASLLKVAMITVLSITTISISSCKKPDACMVIPEYVEKGQLFELNSCSIDAKEYEWNMGDGTIYNSENMSHIYWNYGYYTVTLKAQKGSKESTEIKTIQVVGPAHKFVGSYYTSESCQIIGGDTYNISITKINETRIRIDNFLGGDFIEAQVNGNNITLETTLGVQDASGYQWDLLSGSGYISGNTITLNYTLDDYFFEDIYGTVNCSSTCQRQ